MGQGGTVSHMDFTGNHIPKAGAMSQHSEMGMFGGTPLSAPSSRSFGQALNSAPKNLSPRLTSFWDQSHWADIPGIRHGQALGA